MGNQNGNVARTDVGNNLKQPPPLPASTEGKLQTLIPIRVPVSTTVAQEKHSIIVELNTLENDINFMSEENWNSVITIVRDHFGTFKENGWLTEFLRALRPWMGRLLLSIQGAQKWTVCGRV